MSFLYIFLAVVIVLSFLIAIVITMVSKKSSDKDWNLNSNSSDVKEMLESNNLSKSTIDVIKQDEGFVNKDEDDVKDGNFSFTARRNNANIKNNNEEDEEII